MKALVIADDFTGANDTGVQLAKKGARTEVALVPGDNLSAQTEVLVINTESRASSPELARQQVRQALNRSLRYESAALLYKKIDSTLRGNLGAEIEALMEAADFSLAVMAPATPQAGRVIRGGCCYVNGVLLTETEFASDPKTPVRSAHIGTLIELQSDLKVYEIGLDALRTGKLDALLASLADTASRTIVVVDSETDADLVQVAQAALACPAIPLLVGAAGLANALPAASYTTARQALPVLVMAGSMSEATWHQVEYARQTNDELEVLDIDVETLLLHPVQTCYEWVQQACRVLTAGRHCILRTCQDPAAREQIDALCARHGLTRSALGKRLSILSGQITAEVISCARIGGLFLTGGDIATAVAGALHATGYRIRGEVAPCIPYGTFINSAIDDLPVITKAGGFGAPEVLSQSLAFIEELYRE